MAAAADRLRGQHLHFDPVSGIAGDMTVAALVDAGVPGAVVTRAVDAMGVPGLRVKFEARRRGGIVGRGFVVRAPAVGGRRGRNKGRPDGHEDHGHEGHDHEGHDHEGHAHEGHTREEGHDHEGGRSHDHRAPGHPHAHEHRDYAEIRRLLRRAKLDSDAKALAEEVFARVAEVESALHGSSVADVTFHEVGAFDSIADIVGASAAIAWLAPRSIGSSAPEVGSGTVRTAHGLLPVPAPATAALLHGIAIRATGQGELTTPTGAALLASIVDRFGAPPPMRLHAVGHGAGTRELADRPNVLRVLVGEPVGQALPPAADEVLLLEANLDDMSGQMLAALLEALFAAGAVDAWATPIIMKKGRPAQMVSALAEPARAAAVERAFFLSSTTLGVRKRGVERATLARSMAEVETPYGPVRVKVAGLDGQVIGAEPEYDDCRRRAGATDVPVRRVWTAATAAAAALLAPEGSSPTKRRSRAKARAR